MTLTAPQKRLLTSPEQSRVQKACEKHNDVVRLVRDLRAIRSLRQKQRDKCEGVPITKNTASASINTRHQDKYTVFDQVVKHLEQRLEGLRDAAAQECPPKKTVSKMKTATNLLSRALVEIEEQSKSLYDSNSINGKLVDIYGVVDEIYRLNSLSQDIRTLLDKR